MLDYVALKTLSILCQEGSFEKAADRLNLTQSSISQKIKQLEERTGVILVVRTKPVRPTEVGQALITHVQKVDLLERDALKALPENAEVQSNTPIQLPLAVDVDSSTSWFPRVIEKLSPNNNIMFNVVQDHAANTLDYLRQGKVLGAVTPEHRRVHSIERVPLGLLEYKCVATPEFIERYFGDKVTLKSLKTAPAVKFSPDERVLQKWIATHFNSNFTPFSHQLPTYDFCYKALKMGLGWGIYPIFGIEEDLKSGALVEIVADTPLLISHYWHYSQIPGDVMKNLTDIIVDTSSSVLLPAA